MNIYSNVTKSLEFMAWASGSIDLDENVNIVKYYGTPIVTPTGLVFVPYLDVNLNASAAAKVDLSFDLEKIDFSQITLSYLRGAGWNLDKTDKTTLDYTNFPDIPTINANARVSVETEAGLLVYGIAGAALSGDAFAELNADISANPWWTLKAGIDLDFSLKAGVFGYGIEYNKTIATLEKILLEADSGVPLTINLEAKRLENASTFLFDASKTESETPIEACSFEIETCLGTETINSFSCKTEYEYPCYMDASNVKVSVESSEGVLGSKSITVSPKEDVEILISRPDSYTNYYSPSFSPDGKKIVYEKESNWFSSLEIIDIETKDITPLYFSQGAKNPSWSKANDRIAFNSDVWTTEVYSINPNGNSLKQVTSNDIFDWIPKWSPNGDEMVILSQTPNIQDGQLYIINSFGGNRRQLTFSNDSVWTGDWSDNNEIAFFQEENEIYKIYRVDKSGGTPTFVASGKNPRWFDNNRIIFDDANYIYLIDKDGSNKKQVTHFPTRETNPSVSPDKEFISYERDGGLILQYIPLSLREE